MRRVPLITDAGAQRRCSAAAQPLLRRTRAGTENTIRNMVRSGVISPVRLGFLPVLGAISGCLTLNPAYEEAATAAASSSGTAPATTTVTPSTSSSGSSTASDGSGALTDGSGTLEVSGTSGDTSTSTSTSTGDSTTLQRPASTGIDATTGEPPPPPVVLDHYDIGQCQDPLWSFANPNINNGISGEMRGAECLDSPLAPPFRVQRIHYVIAAVTGAPQIRFQVRDPSMAQVLYESPPMPAAAGAGTYEIPPQDQLFVGTTRFCVGFVGGDNGSMIGMAADASLLPAAGQSFYGSQACNKPGLLDVNNFNPEIIPHGPWCLGAEITSN